MGLRTALAKAVDAQIVQCLRNVVDAALNRIVVLDGVRKVAK